MRSNGRFFGNKFSRKQEAERVCWDPPFLANAVTLGASSRGGSGKSSIVHTIGCGREPLLTDALFQVELPIGLADVQESVDTAQQFAQQSAFELSPNPARIAARVRFPSEPYLGHPPVAPRTRPANRLLPASPGSKARPHPSRRSALPKPRLSRSHQNESNRGPLIGIQELTFVTAQQVDIPRKRLAEARVEPRFETLVAHVEDLEGYVFPCRQPFPYRDLILDWMSCQNCEHKPILERVRDRSDRAAKQS